jgi:mono/diheme cytochrome c family protein
MLKKNWLWIACLAAFAIGCSKSEEPAPTPPATSSTGTTGATASTGEFAPVEAIFAKNCVGCHGAAGGKGGINLTTAEGVNKGGEDGPIVTAGDPDKSKIVDALRGRNGAMQMPKNAAPLPEADIKTVEDWIKAGAKA